MLNYLIVGQTGVGKSSFVNAVFGKIVALTGDFKSCTKVVEYYAYGTKYGDICLIDTPGLGEDSTDGDIAYLKMVRDSLISKNIKIDVTLYVTPITETRFRPNEKAALLLLTKELSTSIWSNSWLVLTFAASLSAKQREKASRERKKDITTYLEELTSQSSPFLGFQKILRVDNIVSNWTSDCVPINSILLEGF